MNPVFFRFLFLKSDRTIKSSSLLDFILTCTAIFTTNREANASALVRKVSVFCFVFFPDYRFKTQAQCAKALRVEILPLGLLLLHRTKTHLHPPNICLLSQAGEGTIIFHFQVTCLWVRGFYWLQLRSPFVQTNFTAFQRYDNIAIITTGKSLIPSSETLVIPNPTISVQAAFKLLSVSSELESVTEVKNMKK